MKNLTSALAVLIAILMIFCSVPMSASAETTTNCENHSLYQSGNVAICTNDGCDFTDTAYSISVVSKDACSGSKVYVDIHLDKNYFGITTADFKISYDNAKLEFVNIEKSNLFSTVTYDETNKLLGIGETSLSKATGIIATLEFKVKATEGETAEIGIEMVSATADEAAAITEFSANGGTVTVVSDTTVIIDGKHTVSAEINGTITAKFHLNVSELLTAEQINNGAYALVFYPHKTRNDYLSLKKVYIKDTTPDKNGKYVIDCEIVPKKLNNDISVAVFDDNGNRVFEGRKHFDLATYLTKVADGLDADAAKVAQALLDYGKLTQVYFGYESSEITAAELAEIVGRLPANIEAPDRVYTKAATYNIALASTSFIANAGSAIRHSFVLRSGYCIDDYTATLTFMGKTKNVDFVANNDGTRYYIDVADIAAADLDSEYTITIYNKDGNAEITLTSTALTYARDHSQTTSDQNLINMLKALYNYNLAANAYFEAN